jgi:hypothetical protein
LQRAPAFFTLQLANPVATSRRIDEILNRLEAAEQQFLAREFFAPVPPGGSVQVRVAGVICQMQVEPRDFVGWGLFRPLSPQAAQFVRPARLAERQRYLELFPLLRLILCGRSGEEWLAVPAHQADRRFRITGEVPVQLVEEGQLFEVIESRFDGTSCWFDRLDPRRDPGAAAYLREALRQMVPPADLERPGLTAEERSAYALQHRALQEAMRDWTEDRLRQALAHAGAELRSYAEREDGYRIEYEVDGARHIAAVSKENLAVQVAGICLSGEDEQFDLESLVGVIREGQEFGAILRVGHENEGMREGDYWRVHPPRRP